MHTRWRFHAIKWWCSQPIRGQYVSKTCLGLNSKSFSRTFQIPFKPTFTWLHNISKQPLFYESFSMTHAIHVSNRSYSFTVYKMRSTCIQRLSVGALGNTEILMINCININFCITLQGSNFRLTSGFVTSPEVTKNSKSCLIPRHKCSRGLSAWIICILLTAKQNNTNK